MKIGNLEVYGIIYKITNKVNGKVYIGQTINKNGFRGRYPVSRKKPLIIGVYNHHKYLLNKNTKGCNQHLLNSIDKYGFESFDVIEIFDVAFSKAELDIKEDFWISFYKSIDDNFGYNRKTGGANGKPSKKSIEKAKKSQIEKGHTRKINQLSIPDLKIIKTYNSISEATNELGLSRSSIKNVLNPKYQANTAGGYAWEYSDCKNIKYKGDIYYDEEHGRIIRGVVKSIKKRKTSIKEKNKPSKKADRKKKKKEKTKIKKEKFITQTSIVLNYMKQGMSIDEIAKITGIKRRRVYQIAHSYDMIPIIKQSDINKEAEIKRKKILELHLLGYRNYEIQKELGFTKSMVEKAIDKYKKNIINIDGEYIK